jgi:hypothetical protein
MAADGATGDHFGQTVAIDGKTAIVAAPLDDNERGTDAGAAYVFVSDASGFWTQQQKLTASDGRTSDFFGEHALAVEGNTIVIGAYGNGQGGDPLNGIPDDDRGAAYVFTRNGTTWTQQTKISQNNFQGGEAADHFGIDVDISGNTLLIGARAASGGSIARAGAAFIYELDCIPPQITNSTPPGTYTSCEASVSTNLFNVGATSFGSNPSYQWRKNGVNIPGATNSAFGFFPVGVSLSDAGTYDVIVSNGCGSEIVGPFTLVVAPFNINPTGQSFTHSGGNGSINVTQPPCNWDATSDASFITITSGASGNANGNILYTVAPNSGSQRTGHINVRFGPTNNPPRVFTVTQNAGGPVILVEDGTANRAVAVDSVNFVRGPFRVISNHNFSADRHTRVILFTSNLGLNQPDPSILTVQAAGFSLLVENVGPVSGLVGLDASYIVVRLPDGLPTGDLPVTVTLRSAASTNSPTLGISP